MRITTIDLDIAKNVFQVHGIDAAEKVVVRRQLRRGQVMKFFEALPTCLVGSKWRSWHASGTALAAVLANQLPRVVSCADACLLNMVMVNMPSRLRSATVIPAMCLSQGPSDAGVQTPRCL